MQHSFNASRPRYTDRRHGGRELARALGRYALRNDVVVLALPRGGVPVAFEVAWALGAPLDVFEARKLGVPGHEELAMGALGAGGLIHIDWETVGALGVRAPEIQAVIERERLELERREALYRDGRVRPPLAGMTVVLVDDGLATGSTMRVAVEALREREPSKIVVAVPVGSADACDALEAEADEVVCPFTPEPLFGVGLWYGDFSQTSDDEVRALLERAARRFAQPLPRPA